MSAGAGAGMAGGWHGGFVFTSGFWTIIQLGDRLVVEYYYSRGPPWRW